MNTFTLLLTIAAFGTLVFALLGGALLLSTMLRDRSPMLGQRHRLDQALTQRQAQPQSVAVDARALPATARSAVNSAANDTPRQAA